jgi:NAD(P)H-dependent FMN reductase
MPQANPRPRLHILICSTRPGRVGETVARWFHPLAVAHGGFDVELVDLAAFGLPVFDEPQHPRLRKYEHQHTKRWSASVESADAFVFVTPEYNYGPPPSLLNALNYLVLEWAYKPVAFVSYGGVSGGMRAVQAERQLATAFRMMPVNEAVNIPMVSQRLRDGKLEADEAIVNAVKPMLDELLKWATALMTMRAKA